MTLPVTLDDAKRQLRILDDENDDEITEFINDAAGWVETHTGHILEPRIVVEEFVGLSSVKLKAWPIESVTVSYLDEQSEIVAVTGSVLDKRRRPAVFSVGVGQDSPFPNTVLPYTVTIDAGYPDPADVPRNLRRAMLILIAAYDADREGGEMAAMAEKTAMALCRKFKERIL